MVGCSYESQYMYLGVLSYDKLHFYLHSLFYYTMATSITSRSSEGLWLEGAGIVTQRRALDVAALTFTLPQLNMHSPYALARFARSALFVIFPAGVYQLIDCCMIIHILLLHLLLHL